MASSGLIAAGVFNNLHGTMGLAGWQWLFIIESATGAFFALIGPFFIPGFPGSKTGAGVYWLSEDLRKVAAARLAADRVSEPEASHSVWYGLRLALTDIKTWGFVSILNSRSTLSQPTTLTNNPRSPSTAASPAPSASTTSTQQSCAPSTWAPRP